MKQSNDLRARKIAGYVKVPATKLDSLSLIPKTHMMEGKNQFWLVAI